MSLFSDNNKIRIQLLLSLLFLMPTVVFAVDVKFSVEMTSQINSGLFNTVGDKVYLRGSFNNWDLSTELQRVPGTNIYSRTISVTANSTYDYKYFINSAGASNSGWESNAVGPDRNGNRIVAVGSNKIDLAVMFFDNSNMSLKKETNHFLFYCDTQDENILTAYSERLEGEYRRITYALEASVGSKIHVEIFRDLKTLHTAAGYPEDPDWAVGSAIGKTVIITVSPNHFNEDPASTGLLSVLAHEFVHIVEAWKMTVPLHSMVNEGTAMYLSDFPFVRVTTEVREFILQLGYKPGFSYFEQHFENHGYAFAGTVADFIVVRHGMSGLAKYIGNAVPQTLGYASFTAFESAWHQFLEEFYMPEENSVSKEKAEKVAKNWYKHWNPDPSASDEIINYFLIEIYHIPQLHVFNFKSGGFVMVAVTDRIKPIIGYDFKNEAPEGTFFYRDLFCSHMDDLRTPETLLEWENIYNNNFSGYSTNHVDPLLTVHWHQFWPYNAYYPTDPVFFYEENGRYRTGCGPAAAAQLTKYWNYPERPRYHIIVNDPAWGLSTLNYDTVRAFDWKNMPDFLPVDPDLPKTSYDASAYLVFNLAVGTIHTPGAGGGGNPTNWAHVWATYFNYSFSTSVVSKKNYTHQQWKEIYDSELEKGRPMLMSASTDMEGNGGHYFIVDGCQADNYYHINLGWADVNGYIDGYYPLENLGGFRFNNLALIGLEPSRKEPSVGGPYQNDEHTAALFHFNGNLDNASALSANGVHHGTGISFSQNDITGLGECLRIDNSTTEKQSYITVAHNTNLNLDGDWTIEAWVKINSWGSYHTSYPFLVNKTPVIGGPNYELLFIASNRSFMGSYKAAGALGNTIVASNDTMLEPHKWYHIAYIRDKNTSNVKVLIHNHNKELIYYWTIPYDKFTEENPLLNTRDLFIGWGGNSDNSYLDAYIDELRISNVVRDFSESSIKSVNSFPGDADDNGRVNASDVLSLGIYYGKTGTPRSQSEKGCVWNSFSRTPWDVFRATFADCNGDGLVSAADILCIGYNYNNTASVYNPAKPVPVSKKKSEENPIISLDILNYALTSVTKNDILNIGIRLSNVKELLGTSFTLSWDNEILEIINDDKEISPGGLWSKDALFVQKVFNEKGKGEFGITNREGSIIESDGEILNLKAKVIKSGNPLFQINEAVWTDAEGEKYELSLDANLASVKDESVIKKYDLTNYPNPFNPITQIKFSIADPQKVFLRVFNSIGEQIAVLVNGQFFDAGEYNYKWDASCFASGIYFCRLETAGKILTRKLMVIK